MWQRRLAPYHDLDVGSRVVLVSGGGPVGGTLTWEVEVTELVRGRYESHAEAWAMVRVGLRKGVAAVGLVRAGFLTSGYTADKPDSGWLLAWSSIPVREIRMPRPYGLRIGRHGWLVLDDLDLDGVVSDPGARSSGGQGRLNDAARSDAIEWRAMDVAYEWLVGEGYAEGEIRDTSNDCPYDYEVGSAAAPVLRVEVKGLSGPPGPVEITAGELRSGRAGVETVLAVVYGILVTTDDSGELVASGGTLSIERPWDPREEDLTPDALPVCAAILSDRTVTARRMRDGCASGPDA